MAAAKEGIVKRARRFFKEVRSEMRKVTWPTKNDLTIYTIVVFVSVAIVSGFIWIADSILYKLVSLILR